MNWAVPADGRSHRRAESLGEADGDRIARPGERRLAHAAGDGGVPQLAVHVNRQAGAGRGGQFGQRLQRPDGSAAEVVCVLHANQPRAGVVLVRRAQRRGQIGRGEDAIAPHDSPAGHPADRRGPAGFFRVDVGLGLQQHFIPRLRVTRTAN